MALDNYVNSLEKQGIYGSFLLMENDKVLYEKSIGFANKERQINYLQLTESFNRNYGKMREFWKKYGW